MDIAQEPLDLMTAFARKLVEQNGFNTKIESTTDAVKHWLALIMFCYHQVGNTSRPSPNPDRILWCRTWPRWYNWRRRCFLRRRHVRCCWIFVMNGRLCPNAWLFNYTNPMSIILGGQWLYQNKKMLACATACRIPLPTRYLHGHTLWWASYWVAGINHMACSWIWSGAERCLSVLREKLQTRQSIPARSALAGPM